MGAHVCQFGTTHKMCRCPKTHTMSCPTPDTCKGKQALEKKGENTHYAMIVGSAPPSAEVIAHGPKGWCVGALVKWVEQHPLDDYHEALILKVDLPNHVDGAIDNPDVLDDLPLDEHIRNGY